MQMTGRPFIIRPARLDDIDSLTKLVSELFEIESDFYPDSGRQRKGLNLLLEDKRSIILAAEKEGKVVGMCSVQTVISTAEGGPAGLLEDLIISAEERGKGIGKALLDEAGIWAYNQGITRLQLLFESDNEGARDFYNKLGWLNTKLICRRKLINRY